VAEQLGSAVLTVSVDDTQLQAGLQAARRQAESTGKAMSQGLAGSASTIGGLTSKLDGLQRELQDVEIGSRRFRELRREIEQTEKRLNGLQGRGSGLSNLLTGLAGLGAGAAAGAFLKQSIDAAVQLETITKKLSNTLGPQGAAGALAFTQGLSDQLGLSFKTLAGSFASFTAAATAANVPLQVQKDLFSAVSKAAQQLGLSNDEINGSLLALQQIASKGTVSMEELRGQLGERLPIAFAAAAKGLGVTQRELIKLVETGGLTAREFFPAITKGLNELTAASAGAPTAAQNFQKLGNAFDQLQTSVGREVLPSITEQVKNLTGVLEGVGVVLQANKLGLGGGFIGNALGIIPEQGSRAVGALKALQNQFNLTDEQARALFTDAIAAEGGRYNPFGQLIIDAESFEKALDSLLPRAIEFRNANRDRTGDLKKEEAAAARLLEIDKARADAQKQFIEGPRQALRDAQALQGLQGAALQLAQQQLNIDKLRAAERQAIAEYDKKLSAAGFDRENTGVIQAAAKVEGASLAVRTALVEGSSALQQASRDAALRLVAAQQSLSDAKQLAGVPTFSTGETGPARAAIQQIQGVRQGIEQARQAFRDASAEASQAFLRGLEGQAVDVLQSAARTAGLELQRALVAGRDQLVIGARQAAEALKQSRLQLASIVADPQGLNELLSPQQGEERTQQALQSILPAFRAAQSAFERLTGVQAPDFTGPAQGVLSAVQDFISRVDREQRAQEAVQLNGRSLEVINEALAVATNQLATATRELAAKNWNVNVSVPGGTATGDVIGAVNGAF
jgi:tape measure domain-containing protein